MLHKRCFTLWTNDFFIQRSELRDLYEKVAAGERISEADALRLFESKDLNTVGAIADLACQKKVGNAPATSSTATSTTRTIASCLASFARSRARNATPMASS